MKNLTVHLGWVIVSLVAVISVLLWRSPDGSSLSGYIAFAASIASLVLATVAIFQSILASQSLERSLGEIRSSSQAIVTETSRLQGASLQLDEETANTIRQLKSLPSQVLEMRGEVFEKIDKLDFSSAINSGKAYHNQTDDLKLIKGESFIFGFIIYAMCLSYKTGRPFSVKDLFPRDTQASHRGYAEGMLEAIKKFRVCEIDLEGVAGNFCVKDIGSIDVEEYIQFLSDFKYEDSSVAEASVVIEKFFTPGTEVVSN